MLPAKGGVIKKADAKRRTPGSATRRIRASVTYTLTAPQWLRPVQRRQRVRKAIGVLVAQTDCAVASAPLAKP